MARLERDIDGEMYRASLYAILRDNPKKGVSEIVSDAQIPKEQKDIIIILLKKSRLNVKRVTKGKEGILSETEKEAMIRNEFMKKLRDQTSRTLRRVSGRQKKK